MTFCIAPFVQAMVESDGTVYPCCRADRSIRYGNLHSATLEQLWNGESATELRGRLRLGEPLAMCRDCYEAEKSGIHSWREIMNERHADLVSKLLSPDPGTSEPKPLLHDLDLRLSNVCNFSCRTCGADFSTAWARDRAKLPARFQLGHPACIGSSQTIIDSIAGTLPHLKSIYFAGGEPLLHPEHYTLLRMLLAAGRSDIRLEYNTNLSVISCGQENPLSLWAQFKSVGLGISLDGVGAVGEYIRKGQDWDLTVRNFRKVCLIAPHIRTSVFTTISALNVFHMTEAVEEWIRLGMISPDRPWLTNWLQSPRFLSPHILTGPEREKLRIRFTSYSETLRDRVDERVQRNVSAALDSILARLSRQYIQERETFLEYMSCLDRIRNENLFDVIPEFSSAASDSTA